MQLSRKQKELLLRNIYSIIKKIMLINTKLQPMKNRIEYKQFLKIWAGFRKIKMICLIIN